MMRTPPAPFINLGNHACFTAEYDFSVVLEIDLHDFVGQSEHDCVFGAHPLLDLHRPSRRCGELFLVLRHTLKLTLEVLKQCDFLVQVFRLIFQCLFIARIMFF